jgi:hypothetical protein
MISEDGGASWGDRAWVIRETPDGDQGYTSSVETGTGRVFTASYCKSSGGVTGVMGVFWRLP